MRISHALLIAFELFTLASSTRVRQSPVALSLFSETAQHIVLRHITTSTSPVGAEHCRPPGHRRPSSWLHYTSVTAATLAASPSASQSCSSLNANRSQVSLRSTFSNCHVLFRYLLSFYFCTRIVALGTTIAQRPCNAVRVTNRFPYNHSCWYQLDSDQPTSTTTSVVDDTTYYTPPAHRRGREQPWQMNIKVSNRKSNLHGH